MPVEIPDEMLWRGRELDNDFPLNEDLYIRFENVTGQNADVASIRCPDQSVNRSRYSRPEWVLLPSCLNWGYGSCKVRDIPPAIVRPEGASYEFRIRHDPEELNYSHSEIRAYRNEIRIKKIENKKYRLEFRIRLSQKIIIIKLPE